MPTRRPFTPRDPSHPDRLAHHQGHGPSQVSLELSGGMTDALITDLSKSGVFAGFFVCKWVNGAPDPSVSSAFELPGVADGPRSWPPASAAIGLESAYPAPTVPTSPPTPAQLPVINPISYFDLFDRGATPACIGSLVMAAGQVIWLFYGSAWPSAPFEIRVSASNFGAHLRSTAHARGLVVSSNSNPYWSLTPTAGQTASYVITQVGAPQVHGWLYQDGQGTLTWWRQDAAAPFAVAPNAPLVLTPGSDGFPGPPGTSVYMSCDLQTSRAAGGASLRGSARGGTPR